jgi:hypothetical protein
MCQAHGRQTSVCGNTAHISSSNPLTFRRNIMADAPVTLNTGAQIAAIEAAAAAENAINLATLHAKISTMGLKAAKDIVQ